MFTLIADQNNLTIVGKELLTRGSVNVNQYICKFSEEWDNLVKKVVFSTMIDDENRAYECIVEANTAYYIPWELFVSKNNNIYVGIYGIKDTEVVLPTERKILGMVKDSVLDPNAIPTVPWTPEENPDVPEAGTLDHRRLTHREDEDQHPILAIKGLDNSLTRPLTNSELEEILV